MAWLLASLSVSNRQEFLDAFSAAPGAAGLFTDFDGTLSPIVTDPESARPLPGSVEAIEKLAASLAAVAVVSGRPASFLARHFPPPGGQLVQLYGLHGLERWVGDRAEPVEAAREYAAAVRQAVAEAQQAGVAGLVVEDKGYGLTLHWRAASDEESTGGAGRELAARLAGSFGLLERPGKASVELLPPAGIDKGSVVESLGAGLEVACFLGDDAGDIAAFGALDRLATRGTRAFKIAVTSTEAPSELLERADMVLEDPEQAGRLLSELAGLL